MCVCVNLSGVNSQPSFLSFNSNTVECTAARLTAVYVCLYVYACVCVFVLKAKLSMRLTIKSLGFHGNNLSERASKLRRVQVSIDSLSLKTKETIAHKYL